MSVFSGADLNTVAENLLQEAATTGDKETAKLAAQYVKLIVDHERNENEAEHNATLLEGEWNKFQLQQKAADRQFKLDCVKIGVFVVGTLGCVAIENRAMVASWFTKTFVQKVTPKV